MNEDDLDVLLGTLDEITEDLDSLSKPTKESEALSTASNINLLDNEESTSEINVVTPESILNEYSELDLKNEELEAQIEEIKLKNPEIFNKIKEIENLQKENLDKQSKLKEDLKQSLIDNNQKSVKNDFWTVTYIAEHTKTTFDREKFEKKYPVLAQQFTKVSTVSDSTRWTKKK